MQTTLLPKTDSRSLASLLKRKGNGHGCGARRGGKGTVVRQAQIIGQQVESCLALFYAAERFGQFGLRRVNHE